LTLSGRIERSEALSKCFDNASDELKRLMKAGVGEYEIENVQEYNLGGTLGPKVNTPEIPPL